MDQQEKENEELWSPEEDEELQDWHILGQNDGEITESNSSSSPVSESGNIKKPGTSIFFTSTLFQDTKSKLYNAIRGLRNSKTPKLLLKTLL